MPHGKHAFHAYFLNKLSADLNSQKITHWQSVKVANYNFDLKIPFLSHPRILCCVYVAWKAKHLNKNKEESSK